MYCVAAYRYRDHHAEAVLVRQAPHPGAHRVRAQRTLLYEGPARATKKSHEKVDRALAKVDPPLIPDGLVLLKPGEGDGRGAAYASPDGKSLDALLSRSEIRDLLDVKALLDAGGDLDRALRDAVAQDGGMSAMSLAWVLSQLPVERLGPVADLEDSAVGASGADVRRFTPPKSAGPLWPLGKAGRARGGEGSVGEVSPASPVRQRSLLMPDRR